MTYIITVVLKLIISLAIVVLTPFGYKALIGVEKKAIAVAGESNYNFLKIFVVDLIKSRPSEFYEDELVKIIDIIDNRFGNKFTENEIKLLVDSTIKDFDKTVISSVPVDEKTSDEKVITNTDTNVIEKLQETLDLLKSNQIK